jgi:hypothetical protein
MFTSAKKYIEFFQNIKSNPQALKKAEIQKHNFEVSFSNYIFAAILGTVLFFFMNSFIYGLSGGSTFAWIILASIGNFYFLMTFISLVQLNHYLLKEKESSFKQVWSRNMGVIAAISRYSPLIAKYPQTSAFEEKVIYQDPESHISLDDFALFIGKSTGLMSQLSHSSALVKDQDILLNDNDACKNILVLGGIGSGKTSTIMQSLMLQLFHQGCGGLIFDIKGDVKKTALNFAEVTNRQIRILGPLQSKFNLLCMIPPEIASSFLKSALLLSNSHSNDSFWIDTASELARNVLGLLSFIPKYYTIKDLYLYIFDEESHDFLEIKLKEVKDKLSPEQKRLFSSYHRYKTAIFDTFDEKIKSGVKATLAQILSPFNHPELTDAFCSEDELNIEEILNGTVFLVDMPISKWGLGAKVVYTFIKLRFFNLMQKHHNASERKLPVFFMCDEFQEIVSCNKDGLSDLNFWDKARSSKTIGIISAQSIASFFAATPNRDYAYALLQNFRNKICLASEDPLTIEYISKLTGKAKTVKKSQHTGSNASTTLSESRDDVLEAQVFRSLSPQSALALLTINNISRDDALKLYPIFLEELKL